MPSTHPFTQKIDRTRLAQLRQDEDQAFRQRIPRSIALRERALKHMPLGVPMPWMAGLWRTPPLYIASGQGAYFTDVDNNAYLDFNLCDLAMTVGYGNTKVAEAADRQMRQGAHYLAATEDAIAVSEELSQRMGLPHWQYTLAASGSNTEVIRIARFVTQRPRIVIFGGHYHGHLEETLVRDENGQSVPDTLGLSPGSSAHTTVIAFNDLAALEQTLARGDVALVLTEPAMTNCNLIMPEPGFHAGVRELTERYGTLLCIDEAHTLQFAYGGLTRAWGLSPDFIVAGKGLGSGVSFALYGMTEAIADVVTRTLDIDDGSPRGLALGGTLYGSALAMAVARVMLEEILTPSAYERVAQLGSRLASGLSAVFAERQLPWSAFHCGPRSGYCLAPCLPRNGEEGYLSLDYDLIDARRVFMANRGYWDAVGSAGPQACIAHTQTDIDGYVAAAAEFLDRIIKS